MHRHSDFAGLADLAPALVARVPTTLREVGGLLEEEHPDYARFLTEQFDEIVAGAKLFMMRLVSPAGQDRAELSSGVEQAAFEEIGRQHCREGREVTSLLSAYRIGARVAWQHATEAALAHGVPAAALASLGSTLFAAVDQLSAASLRGFLREHTSTVSTRERLREELAELLLSGRADIADVRAASARAHWPVPRETTIVLADPDSDVARALLGFDGNACLRVRQEDALVVIVPDPNGPGRRGRLSAALRGAGTVVGPVVPVDGLATSLSVARTAARLRRAGVLTDDPLFTDEHLDALIVHQDDRLLTVLRQRHLAPLAGLPGHARQRLEDTLRSWLRNLGDRRAIAQELHIHPQTVCYRLRQLRDRFGDALADPRVRQSLMLALAWEPDAAHEPPNRAASQR
ncbi:helix-turn-helix domain-containing protein [Allokutzneria oryzae]|uniref:Helix-turn-helix domain-containing protein n=1 Tax=Allokutzneria oryzae TaxID=1378989 RepID=A0ABV6A120_9PSEU